MEKTLTIDGRPTMSEWPVRIWEESEIRPQFANEARLWLEKPFEFYEFVHAPGRRTNPSSFTYMFGYGNDKIFFMREDSKKPVKIKREQITDVFTEKELLNAKIIVHYQEKGNQRILEFPYIPSVYYLYDPFLNWMLGLDKKFMPMLAEKEHPRPVKLYKESLAMFNYSIGAYRLGDRFVEYDYKSRQQRCKWMPWKKEVEEWLEIPMERGVFKLHTVGYMTECCYEIKKQEK